MSSGSANNMTLTTTNALTATGQQVTFGNNDTTGNDVIINSGVLSCTDLIVRKGPSGVSGSTLALNINGAYTVTTSTSISDDDLAGDCTVTVGVSGSTFGALTIDETGILNITSFSMGFTTLTVDNSGVLTAAGTADLNGTGAVVLDNAGAINITGAGTFDGLSLSVDEDSVFDIAAVAAVVTITNAITCQSVSSGSPGTVNAGSGTINVATITLISVTGQSDGIFNADCA